MDQSNKAVTRWRMRKNLCLMCGMAENNTPHECQENYIKADMRGMTIDAAKKEVEEKPPKPENPYNISLYIANIRIEKGLCPKCGAFEIADTTHKCVENDFKADMRGADIESKLERYVEADIEEERRKKATILSYREKKNLCLLCGNNLHPGKICESEYTKADNRTPEEKLEKPLIVQTPREKSATVTEIILKEKIDDMFRKETKNSEFYKLTNSKKRIFNRKYAIIDLSPSETNQKFTYEYIQFMQKKYPNYILFLIGNIEDSFSVYHCTLLQRSVNVRSVTNLADQNIVDYISNCQRLFGFPSKYITYCVLNNIKCTTFIPNNVTLTGSICNMVNLDVNENVTIDIVKRNALASRI